MLDVLVVIHSFQNYGVGDLVSEEGEVADITRGEHANRAVRVRLPIVTDDPNEDN